MLAARWVARRDVRVEEIDDPGPPRAGWVRLRVEACGICGTDVEEYVNGPIVVPTLPHPLSGRCAPLTLGHEAVGVVEAVGAGVDLALGLRVAVEANLFCGECWWCQRRYFQLCPWLASLGLMADGGLAEVLLAPAYMCIPYRNDVPADAAVLAEPLSVAVRAVRRGGIGLGSRVGVVGAGTIGLLIVQAARLAGAEMVVATDRVAKRRALALELGADAAVAPEEVAPAGLDLTGGVGFDVVIEASGDPVACRQAITLVRRGGRVVLLGLFDRDLIIPMVDFLLGEKEVVACLSHIYDTDFATAVSLIDRRIVRTAPLITDRIALTELVEWGFEALLAEPSAHVKVIVTPNASFSQRHSAWNRFGQVV